MSNDFWNRHRFSLIVAAGGLLGTLIRFSTHGWDNGRTLKNFVLILAAICIGRVLGHVIGVLYVKYKGPT